MAENCMEESRVFRDFEIQQILGSGGFGFVLQVQHIIDKQKYALKLTLNTDHHTAKEVEHLAKIKAHENVVAYVTSWVDTINTAEMKCLAAIGFSTRTMRIPRGVQQLQVLCIQMELCGQDLRHWLRDQTTVDDTKCKNIFLQILKGLQHIHDQNLIHRDLKPDNIFFAVNDPSKIKIGDFGIAAIHNDSIYINHTEAIGTILYMAPEQNTPRYDKRVDLFAMGLILFEIYHPPAQNDLRNSIDNLRNKKKFPKEFKRQKWPKVTDTILSLLQDDPTKRPSIEALTETFSDKFSIGKANGQKLKYQVKNDKPDKQNQPNDKRRPSTHGTACVGCARTVNGKRYKCNSCDDFNYCNHCYKAAATHRVHHNFTEVSESSSELSSPLVDDDMVHHCVECNGCEDIQIIGRRYQCKTCTNVNFCRKCYVSETLHRMVHAFNPITVCELHQTVCKRPIIEHHGIQCHKCKVAPITGIRYSCKSCPFVDYCENCYELSKKHKILHVFQKITKCAVHNVVCSHCSQGIVGTRYKCKRCENLDYCYACYYKCKEHRRIHEFYVIH